MIVGHLPFPCRLTALLVTDNEETEMVAFRFGCVVFVERTEGGPSKLAWMVVPALPAAWQRHLILLRANFPSPESKPSGRCSIPNYLPTN